jgi:MoxR-like ATPase
MAAEHGDPTDFDTADVAALLERTQFEIKRVLVGQDRMIERMLVSLLARGHLLLEGVPGVAKTLAVRTLAEVIGGSFRRLQFTPDLMPGDIVGTRMWRPSAESFDIELGPVFANLVLADEINRAPAKVQSALLEAMAERQVSIGGRTYPLPQPFLVLATQNPIESEGVYALPEAQRDRFLMKVDVHHPGADDELAILQRMSVAPPSPRQLLRTAEVLDLQAAADSVFVHHAVAQYAVALVMATREPTRYGVGAIAGHVELGASPRATLGLVAGARALALMRGRDFVLPHDVSDLASDVISHRLLLTFDALADGVNPRQIVDYVLSVVPAPKIATHPTPEQQRGGAA